MTPRPKSPSPIAQKVYDALATYLRRDVSSFQDEDSLRDDLGLDSLMTIELLYEIESVFDLQIPDEDFGGLVTIGNVIAYIEKKKPARRLPFTSEADRVSHETQIGNASIQIIVVYS